MHHDIQLTVLFYYCRNIASKLITAVSMLFIKSMSYICLTGKKCSAKNFLNIFKAVSFPSKNNKIIAE